MEHIFIINPVAGKTNAAVELEPRIRQVSRELGVDVRVEITRAAGDAARIARDMAACGRPVRLYACGGDGTLNEILQGAAGHPQVELACLPLGSGNDFVRNFSCPIERFRDVKAQIRGEAQSLDVILTDRGYCAAICSAGLDAQVAYGIPKFRRIPLCGGTMAYKLSILQQLLGPLGRRLVLEIDGQRMEQDCLMAAVCNGSTYGGGFYAAPQASLTDGLLDVVVVRRIGLLRIARVLGLYKAGRHMRDGEVLPELQDVIWTTRARHVAVHPADGGDIVVNRDGECAPLPGLEAQIVPGAVRFVLPAEG